MSPTPASSRRHTVWLFRMSERALDPVTCVPALEPVDLAAIAAPAIAYFGLLVAGTGCL